MNKVDILVFAAHPDDAELSCAGTIAKQVAMGLKVAIVELTESELSSRGTIELRKIETAKASEILGISYRENLKFKDGFFVNDEVHQKEIIKVIRKYQPKIVIANSLHDRHPDHGRAGDVVSVACFLSGLRKIETEINGIPQKEWRPSQVFRYIQDRYIKPDFVIDITAYWEIKKQSIKVFQSQFFDPTNNEPMTYISKPDFLDFVEARSREMGHSIGVTFGEGFTTEKMISVNSLFDII